MTNLLIVSGFGLAALTWMAEVQALTLWWVGERPCWRLPLRHGSESEFVRWAMKVALQGALLTLLVGVPLALGENPLTYHLDRLPLARASELVSTLVPTIVLVGSLFVVYSLGGMATFETRHSTTRILGKVGRAVLSPLPLALMEEAVFRGVVTEQFLRAWGPDRVGVGAALVVTAALFSSVHFMRPKRTVWLPWVGLFGLGLILGLAYVLAGHTYWVPVGIHAGGVLVIQISRPFTRLRGPVWLTGYPSYPISGVLGLGVMTLLMVYLTTFGVLS
jgi:membrane protease YdiL (CAAX protease family)